MSRGRYRYCEALYDTAVCGPATHRLKLLARTNTTRTLNTYRHGCIRSVGDNACDSSNKLANHALDGLFTTTLSVMPSAFVAVRVCQTTW